MSSGHAHIDDFAAVLHADLCIQTVRERERERDRKKEGGRETSLSRGALYLLEPYHNLRMATT